MGTLKFQETYPAGPISMKYRTFVEVEDFLEVGYLGGANTGKTQALITAINKTAIEYPGCNMLLFRGELTTLKRSTLATLLDKYRELEDIGMDTNKQEAIIKWPEVNGKRSTLMGIGLNSGDYKVKLKTLEFFRSFGDEVNECIGDTYPDERLDFVLFRTRQKAYHRLTYAQLIQEMLYQNKIQTPDEGLVFFGITVQQLHTHPQGRNYTKWCANDEGNDWIWNRIINYYGDKPHPPREIGVEGMKKWVHENVGITEVHITPDRKPIIESGNVILLPNGEYHQVKGVEVGPGGREYQTHTGATVPGKDATLVLEKLAIYPFMEENHSANAQGIQSLYLVKREIADQYMSGLVDTKSGLMHPQFSVNTHVIPQEPIPKSWQVKVLVDYNIDSATALFWAENEQGEVVIFDEYEGNGVSSKDNAFEILKMLDRPVSEVEFIADPAMWHRDPREPSKSVALDYEEVFNKKMTPANNERQYGIQQLQELLTIRTRITPKGMVTAPLLWVMEHCEMVRNGSDKSKGLSNMTWELWKKKKEDHISDCLRYGAATRKAGIKRTRKPGTARVSGLVWKR